MRSKQGMVIVVALALLVLGTGSALAQPAEPAWSLGASLYSYFPPDSQNYLQPTIRADRDWLHLETRYNYEALQTGSVWIGYNFSVGNELKLDFTPMLGAVSGKTNGLAPGFEATLTWRKLQFYGEAEYVLDKDNSADSYFYMWSELTYAASDWFRFGLVGQRTRAYQTDVETQRGLLARFTYKKADLTAHVFNPGTDYPTYVLSVGVSF
jgi:hypothetical protein